MGSSKPARQVQVEAGVKLLVVKPVKVLKPMSGQKPVKMSKQFPSAKPVKVLKHLSADKPVEVPKPLCAWEQVRLNNIKEQEVLLEKLGFLKPKPVKLVKAKRFKIVKCSHPVRRSARNLAKL